MGIVPTAVRIGPHKYKINLTRTPAGRLGDVCYQSLTIRINPQVGERKRSPAEMTETFWHEVTHAILYDMKNPLFKDESFVEGFSKRLNVAVNTAEFR